LEPWLSRCSALKIIWLAPTISRFELVFQRIQKIPPHVSAEFQCLPHETKDTSWPRSLAQFERGIDHFAFFDQDKPNSACQHPVSRPRWKVDSSIASAAN